MIHQNGSAAPRILSPQKEALQQHFISLVRKIDDHKPCGEFGERSVGVIGAQAGQGGSSIAMNLALAAAQVERHMLLVDANHDQPKPEQLIGVRRSPGFSDRLNGGLVMVKAKTVGGDVAPKAVDRLRAVARN